MSYAAETAFDTAARIAAGDDGTTYDKASIRLHWVTALLVVVQFGLAETWDYFDRPTQHSLQALHVSLGIALAVVIVTRLVWRLMPSHEVEMIERGWVKFASRSVHYLLYALLVAEVGLGFLFRWAQGEPLSFFGLFAIPSPFGAFSRPARHLLHSLHEYVGWAIVIIAFGHALAALYHHYVLKDRVLVRMLPRGAKQP